jgi:hypothetical protein
MKGELEARDGSHSDVGAGGSALWGRQNVKQEGAVIMSCCCEVRAFALPNVPRAVDGKDSRSFPSRSEGEL